MTLEYGAGSWSRIGKDTGIVCRWRRGKVVSEREPEDVGSSQEAFRAVRNEKSSATLKQPHRQSKPVAMQLCLM